MVPEMTHDLECLVVIQDGVAQLGIHAPILGFALLSGYIEVIYDDPYL